MSRVQLGLNVSNLEEAITFYSKMFATEPRKVEPGYANFAIDNPPLKLVLFEGSDGGSLNHLGVEVETREQVSDADLRLQAEGMSTAMATDNVCCYALKDETWVSDPDGARWEWYTVNEDVTDAAINGSEHLQDGCDPNSCCP